MNWSIDFAPFFSWTVLAILCIPALFLAAALVFAGLRGAVLRVLAIAALMLALLNPVVLREERDPLKSVVALVVDRSQSQTIGERTAQTDEAVAALKERLAAFPQFELREVDARSQGTSDASTALFGALRSALSDVSPGRVGGAIMVTDGQVHDIPANAQALGFDAPVHALVTGRPNEFDRRLDLVTAPRFGLVEQPQTLTYRVVEEGPRASRNPVEVQVFLNGDLVQRQSAVPGEPTSVEIRLPRAGKNIVEISAARDPGEITPVNNRAIAVIDGIRENLRVLLVSGEPHAGERTWRNLLKSDAAVDLVHFTILRPPEKQDGTPINELSLIAFPTRELFVEKIEDFDLIIFDRYQRRGVLPTLYYDYIAQYVRNGGAMLIASGPEYAGPDSVANSPLASILPALPTGEVDLRAYRPVLSELGRKHPVTRDLPGSESSPPKWSPWFRTVDVGQTNGEVVMTGPDKKPLLVLNRAGEGRVALLLSDQGWLWSRGYEGGGPHVALFRRLAHWLMKEPELEEEALDAEGSGTDLLITRHTIGGDPGPATVVTPTGRALQVTLADKGNGEWQGQLATDELGLYQVANGDLRALANIGPVNPREYREAISTTAKLQPIADQSRGSVRRLAGETGEITVPRVVPMAGRADAEGRDWIGLRTTEETVLRGVNRTPLFAGFLGLAVLLLALSATWYREGR
ncbi:membrane protein [Aureimonas ureilytica]|uniref:membrane protein n=1 Tax=Aureimonas ureilytica TaxID=401562 RepID=UPI00037C53B0|nr:membrane protein [Aureimonas ureilytica]